MSRKKFMFTTILSRPRHQVWVSEEQQAAVRKKGNLASKAAWRRKMAEKRVLAH